MDKLDKLSVAKDKTVGKIMETAGKVTNDEELEFTGKFRSITSDVKEKLYDVKEDVFQEANNLMDRINKKDKS